MNDSLSPSLAAVVAAHHDELTAFLRRKVGCPAMAADIVQDMWVRLAVSEPSEPIRDARAFLYRVAGNLAIDRLRREQTHTRHIVAGRLPEKVASVAPSAFHVVAAQQEFRLLQEAVRELPEKCRAVFLLYRGHGLSMREIAVRLGIAEKTVENHIAKAMRHCRMRLRAAGGDV
jgi:RNA polymerase sigma factor (sigma-70 family)